MSEKRLTFTVPGKVVSNNRVARFGKGVAHKSGIASTYQQRVFQIAFAAVKNTEWQAPIACEVFISLWNQRIDIDNAPKLLLDGMIGCVYQDDSVVRNLFVTKNVDEGEARVEVRVEPCVPLPSSREIARLRAKVRKGRAA